jgi:hypothetical protein
MTDSSKAAAATVGLSPARWMARTGLDKDSAAVDLCEPLLELVDDEEKAHPGNKHEQVGNLMAAMHKGSISKQQELEYQQPSEDEQQQGLEPIVLFSLWDYLCLVIILPTLLVVQFRMALRISRSTTTTGTTGSTGSMHWLVVDKALPLWIVIALYVISALLYKICLQDLYRLRQRIKIGKQNHDSTEPQQLACWWTFVWTSCVQQLVLLLPEVLMDVVLGVVWCVSAEAAAVVLVWATILLSGLVVVGSAHTLWHYYHHGTRAVKDPPTTTADHGIDLEMDVSQRDGILRIPLTE